MRDGVTWDLLPHLRLWGSGERVGAELFPPVLYLTDMGGPNVAKRMKPSFCWHSQCLVAKCLFCFVLFCFKILSVVLGMEPGASHVLGSLHPQILVADLAPPPTTLPSGRATPVGVVHLSSQRGRQRGCPESRDSSASAESDFLPVAGRDWAGRA